MVLRPSSHYNGTPIAGKTVFVLKRPSGDVYMRQWPGPSMVQAMACRRLPPSNYANQYWHIVYSDV